MVNSIVPLLSVVVCPFLLFLRAIFTYRVGGLNPGFPVRPTVDATTNRPTDLHSLVMGMLMLLGRTFRDVDVCGIVHRTTVIGKAAKHLPL